MAKKKANKIDVANRLNNFVEYHGPLFLFVCLLILIGSTVVVGIDKRIHDVVRTECK